MDIQSLCENGRKEPLFTDYDVCVLRSSKEWNFSGGRYLDAGAFWFDIASITKALTDLNFLKLFSEKIISPDDLLEKFVRVPNSNGRQLRHFLTYTAKEYAFYFDYEKFNRGKGLASLKQAMLDGGFGDWLKRFQYDNFSSVFLGVVLEKIFGTSLGEVFNSVLCTGGEKGNLLFHPVKRGMSPNLFVPTREEESLRGIVHDPVSRAHQHEELSIAGVFSDAQTIAHIFHRTLEPIIRSGFYSIAAKDQLAGMDKESNPWGPWGLGFDIPLPKRFPGLTVEEPLIFAGHTGGRIFFASKPRITVCILTNFALFRNGEETLDKYKAFCWQVLNEALRCAC